MDWEAIKKREQEVVAAWKERNAETPPRFQCYDCTSDFLYESEPNLTVHHIREGRFGWDEPDKIIPLCEMHLSIRRAGVEKYSLTHLSRLQIAVGHWGEVVFPESNAGTIADHLAEEMVELLGSERVWVALCRAESENNDQEVPPAHNPAEESADILLMLLHLAHRLNYDLMESTLKKFSEIEDADWEDDGRGYKKRVKPKPTEPAATD